MLQDDLQLSDSEESGDDQGSAGDVTNPFRVTPLPDGTSKLRRPQIKLENMRCQSLLHMAMCRYKKDTALKYSGILSDHFKSSPRLTQAPSPCVARSIGVPSHPSAMPCPASSVSSQPGLNASNCSGNSTGSSFSVPYNIPNITSSYVNTTSYIIYAYDIWEKADALARKNMEPVDSPLCTQRCAADTRASTEQYRCPDSVPFSANYFIIET
ncbi:unnamed protein product [Bubo scandiacus]